eukprot:jgi/Ulvmu1/3373/UM156_0030.1
MAARRVVSAFKALASNGSGSGPLCYIGALSYECSRHSCRRISTSPVFLAVSELTMPSLSPTMTMGNIAQWNIAEGEAFSAGDVIAEIETDKATMGWESQDDGVMAKILKPAGTKDIEVGTAVALTVEDESELALAQDHTPGSSANDPAPTVPVDSAQAIPASPPSSAFPAHQVWTMPALSPTMTQGNIAKWYKQVGDEVSAGDGLVEVETDKATMMWESVEEGYVAKILSPDGSQDISVGTPVVVIVEDEEMVPAFSSYTAADAGTGGASGGASNSSSAPEGAAKAAATATPAAASKPAADASSSQTAKQATPASGRKVSSPYARKLAHEAGIDISQIQGSGPGGRVTAADVEGAGASGARGAAATFDTLAEFTEEAVKQVQKVTAKRLLESKTTVPHYYLTYECQVDNLLLLRKQLNDHLKESSSKVSVNDFIIKASAAALRVVPDVNSSWQGDFIRRYHNVDVSVAVQTPAGLMVPVVRDADLKGLQSISEDVKLLASKAKEGKLAPHEYTGGTFTVSNLGMYGVNNFAAIINPPQAAILACGSAQPKVILGKDGNPMQVMVMNVTMSCDHRVVDGAIGAAWLQAFKKLIESPERLLL